MTKETKLKSLIKEIVKEEITSKRRLNESKFEEPTEENLKKYGLDPFEVEINLDGSIDYDDDVDLSWKNLKQIPFQFNKVSGNFFCNDNQLTSLQGAPQKVGGGFNCYNNKLTSLKYSPQRVDGYFSCSGNQLTSLQGAPRKVGKNFWCDENKTKFTIKDVRKVSDVGRIVNV